jgi:hypothetical protein
MLVTRCHILSLLSTLCKVRIESNLTREQSFMFDYHAATCERDHWLENLAAELTNAAYRRAHRQGMTGSWLDLELGLGRVLAETVERWARTRPSAKLRDDFKAWREGILVDLTEGAFHVSVKNGVKGFPLELELHLYRAFRSVIRRRCGAGSEKVRHS